MRLTSRRDFLKLSASSLAVVAGSPLVWSRRPVFAADKGREFLMFCDSDAIPGDLPNTPTADSGTVKGLDVASGESFAIDVPFFGHTVTQNPVRPHQVVSVEKWGSRGALIDIQSHTILETAAALDQHTFFGHSSFTPDGELLIASEDTYEKDNGKLSVRDARSLKIVRTLSGYGAHPHECRLLKDGTTILIANQGVPEKNIKPNLAWIDLATGKLLNSLEYSPPTPDGQTDRHFIGSFGHFDVAYDGWVCCGGLGTSNRRHRPASLNGPHAVIGFVSPAGKMYFPDLPEEVAPHMLGEGLSVAVLGETGLAAVTISAGSMCLIFDYKTQKLVHRIKKAHVKGVQPLRDTADAGNGVILLSRKELTEADFHTGAEPSVSSFNADVHGIGSHLKRLYV